MPKTIKLLVTVSRPEFLPANSASLVIGISWGVNLPVDLILGLIVPATLVFGIITLVSAFAAQVNTISDYELDLKDNCKRELVQALGLLERGKLKFFIVLELLSSLVLLFALYSIVAKPALIFMWMAAVFLAYAYSAPPLRLKSKAWLAPITLLIVLSILPVTFVLYIFSSELNPFFFIFLSGQALTVYGVIVPAEIRDYFGDKSMGIDTLTVRLGLAKASLFSIILLIVGGILCGVGFLFRLLYGNHPAMTIFLLAMAAVYCFVLRKYVRLYHLSKEYIFSQDQSSIEQQILELSARNPQWITLITQIIVFMSLILLVSKILP